MAHKTVLLILALVLFCLIGATASPKSNDSLELTAHEWGTFTSIAGPDGEPVAWRTFGAGPSDLPCFVERFQGFKGGMSTTVRMETPVLYFYGAQASSVNVRVFFPKGVITEWYPKAFTNPGFNTIEWNGTAITPGADEDFPTASGRSHYFAARATDAVPLKVGAQKEKFLFYRGAGTFPLPLSAKIEADGKILVRNIGEAPISGLIAFENRGGTKRYRLIGNLAGKTKFRDVQPLDGDWATLAADLERVLVNEGLYVKEARAMIETWRDSWFEEGTRLFYIVPRTLIDSVLPLNIQPAPAQVSRVFVGRVEIITPAIQEDVRAAIAKNDVAGLQKYGRFLEPIAKRLGVQDDLLKSVYQSNLENSVNCVR